MPQNLFEITKLAKKNKAKAEEAILAFTQKTFPTLNIAQIRINQSAVSLNSVNGFLTAQNGKEYFFKFHAEEGEEQTMADEYYQSHVLEKAGLPILKPIDKSVEPGSQFLIYDKVNAPTAFDEFASLEENPDPQKEAKLLAAEARILKAQSQLFLNTLELSPREEVAKASLNQLFHTRLAGKKGAPPRLDLYYTGQKVILPNGEIINFNDLAQKRWIINGIEYSQNLAQIINEAKDLLDPEKEAKTPTVIGHGDDHNGNKFFIAGAFLFFDPAFAGRQPALLSFIKATAHNTFLHPFWLYESAKLAQKGLELDFSLTDDTIEIKHNWDMAKQSPIRQKMLDLQTAKIWQPLIAKMRGQNILPAYYQEYIRKALFCCPFLVYNLIDSQKYSPVASLLALSKCVELGSKGDRENYVDRFLEKLT